MSSLEDKLNVRDFLYGSFTSIHTLDGVAGMSGGVSRRGSDGVPPQHTTRDRRLTPELSQLLNLNLDGDDSSVGGEEGSSRDRRASSTISLGSVAALLGLPPPPQPMAPLPPPPMYTALHRVLTRSGGALLPLMDMLGLPPPSPQFLQGLVEVTLPAIPLDSWHVALGVIRVEAMASKFAKLAVAGKATLGANEIAAVAGALASKELEVASWEVYKKALQRAEHERTTAHRLATMIEALSSSSSSSSAASAANSSGSKMGVGGSGDGGAVHPPLPRGFRSAPIDTPLATSKLSCLAPGGGVEEGADPASTASDRLFFEHCKSKCPRDKLPNLIRKHVFAICRVPRGSLWVPPAFLPPPTPIPPTQSRNNGSRSLNSSSNSISDLDVSSTVATTSRSKGVGEEGGGAGVTRRPQLAIPNGAAGGGAGGGGSGGSGGSLSPTPVTTPFITLPSTGGMGGKKGAPLMLPLPPSLLPPTLPRVHLSLAQPVAALSGNHGVGAKVAVWAALFDKLHAPAAQLLDTLYEEAEVMIGSGGRGGGGAMTTSLKPPPDSHTSAYKCALRAGLGDFRFYALMLLRGLLARYDWMTCLQQTLDTLPSGGSSSAVLLNSTSSSTVGSGGSGSGGGGGNTTPALNLSRYLSPAVSEALHASVHTTLFALHALAFQGEDAAATPALGRASRLSPTAYGLPAMYSYVVHQQEEGVGKGGGEGALQEDTRAAALAAIVYGPAIQSLRLLVSQCTPMSKMGALKCAVKSLSISMQCEAALFEWALAKGGGGEGSTPSTSTSPLNSSSSSSTTPTINSNSNHNNGTSPLRRPPNPLMSPLKRVMSVGGGGGGSGGSGGLGALSPKAHSPQEAAMLEHTVNTLPPTSFTTAKRTSPMVVSADDVMPRLCFVIAQAWGGGVASGGEGGERGWVPPPQHSRPYAQLSYIEEGVPEELLNGEEGYLLTSLRGALHYVVELSQGEGGMGGGGGGGGRGVSKDAIDSEEGNERGAHAVIFKGAGVQ